MKDAWRHLLGMETSEADVQALNSPPGKKSRGLTKKASVVGTTELEALFNEIDTDKDGVLSKEEINAYFTKKFGSAPGASLLTKMIDSLDVNHDGVLDYDELAAVTQ